MADRLLYDLAGDAGRRVSPYCWRAKLALAHKGLDFTTAPVPFRAIRDIPGGDWTTVPVLADGATMVGDSFAIAEHLEATYPHAPGLFGGPAGLAHARFVESYVNTVVSPPLFKAIVLDVHDRLEPEDRPYFRTTREKRFGTTLENLKAGAEDHRLEAIARLQAVGRTLHLQPFIAGDAPAFADYVLFGTLRWAEIMTDGAFPEVLAGGVAGLADWYARVGALNGGVGRRDDWS